MANVLPHPFRSIAESDALPISVYMLGFVLATAQRELVSVATDGGDVDDG